MYVIAREFVEFVEFVTCCFMCVMSPSFLFVSEEAWFSDSEIDCCDAFDTLVGFERMILIRGFVGYYLRFAYSLPLQRLNGYLRYVGI
ncbi:hypothetical protein F4782DRAFT_506714 [Xylaria castorea]|nr:hypothetical protein F4782DRAFT_506714 [Xylaria castorea]